MYEYPPLLGKNLPPPGPALKPKPTPPVNLQTHMGTYTPSVQDLGKTHMRVKITAKKFARFARNISLTSLIFILFMHILL